MFSEFFFFLVEMETTTKAIAPSTEPSTTKATALSTEPSTINHPKTPNRKQEVERSENIAISYTSKTRTRIFPTTEATTLRTNKPQTTMVSNPLDSLLTRVVSGPQGNIASKEPFFYILFLLFFSSFLCF